MIGNPTPDFIYGFLWEQTIKGFDAVSTSMDLMALRFTGVWGRLNYLYSRYNYAQFKLDRWHGEGTSNWVPRLGDKYAINRLPSTFGIEDGSYLRLRNIQIGYNFGAATLAKAKIKNLRIYANVQNLKTFKTTRATPLNLEEIRLILAWTGVMVLYQLFTQEA